MKKIVSIILILTFVLSSTITFADSKLKKVEDVDSKYDQIKEQAHKKFYQKYIQEIIKLDITEMNINNYHNNSYMTEKAIHAFERGMGAYMDIIEKNIHIEYEYKNLYGSPDKGIIYTFYPRM